MIWPDVYVSGVQAADLLASGLRKLFRGEFNRQHEIALLLGANMVGELTQAPIVRLISLSRAMPVRRQNRPYPGINEEERKAFVAALDT